MEKNLLNFSISFLMPYWKAVCSHCRYFSSGH